MPVSVPAPTTARIGAGNVGGLPSASRAREDRMQKEAAKAWRTVRRYAGAAAGIAPVR